MGEEVFQMSRWFEGRVRGVGFRSQTKAVACGFEITGWARELDDGRVLVYAEGDEAEARAFMEAIEREMPGYIRGRETATATGERRARGFRVL